MNTSTLCETIKIDVESIYLPYQSDPQERRFVCAYTITIRNNGTNPAQLANGRTCGKISARPSGFTLPAIEHLLPSLRRSCRVPALAYTWRLPGVVSAVFSPMRASTSELQLPSNKTPALKIPSPRAGADS